MNFKKILKYLNYALITLFIAFLLLITIDNDVHAASDTSSSTDFEVPEEFYELYGEDVKWYKTNAKYWQINHKKHHTAWNDYVFGVDYVCCDQSKGKGNNESYLFTKFEKTDGSRITNVKYLDYAYIDNDGVEHNVHRIVDELKDGNTSYYADGNLLSLDYIYGFNNGNGTQLSGTVVPGLYDDYNGYLRYLGFSTLRSYYHCKIAWSQEDLYKIKWDKEFNESTEYEECDYLLYFPSQIVKEVKYIDIWWAEEVENVETVVGGSMHENGEHIQVDSNGEITGIYSLEGELLEGYTVGSNGVISDANGKPLISWSDQCQGIALSGSISQLPDVSDNCKCPGWMPSFLKNIYHSIFCSDNIFDKTFGVIKLIGAITGTILGLILIIWIVRKLTNLINFVRGK